MYLCSMLLTLTSSIHAVNTKWKGHNNHPHAHIPLLNFSRDGLVRMLNQKNLSKGAEIGVSNGEFTANLLRNWIHCEKYILLDDWNHKPPKHSNIFRTGISVGSRIASIPAPTDMEIMKTKLRDFQHKVVYINNASLIDFASTVADRSLDFIYIDAYNNYCEVGKRLQAWWPKLSIAGIIAGK